MRAKTFLLYFTLFLAANYFGFLIIYYLQIWCLLLFYIRNCLLLFYLCKCLLLFYLCNCLLLFYLWNWCLLLFYLWNCLLLFSACEIAYFYTTCETAYFPSTLEWCLLFSSTCAMCIFSIFYLLTFLLACLSFAWISQLLKSVFSSMYLWSGLLLFWLQLTSPVMILERLSRGTRNLPFGITMVTLEKKQE